MKITFLVIGKTEGGYLAEGIEKYVQRLNKYVQFEIIARPVPKKWQALPADRRTEQEGQIIMDYLKDNDYSVLLDEKGRAFSSRQFAEFIKSRMVRSTKRLLFVAGGPWGFSDEVKSAATMQLSLSPMTFSHQMVRLIFTEQLYRAFSIIRGEPYHNA